MEKYDARLFGWRPDFAMVCNTYGISLTFQAGTAKNVSLFKVEDAVENYFFFQFKELYFQTIFVVLLKNFKLS